MIKAEWTNKDSLDLQPTCNQLATTEGDLISRQDAIECCSCLHPEDCWAEIKALPPVEPRPATDGCISRQAAIDALCRECSPVGYECRADCTEVEILRKLPPVEPKPATDDCISRQEAIEEIASHDPTNGTEPYFSGHEIIDIINALPPVEDMGEVSDGYHTFNQLYHQRAVLFATIVNQNKDKAWKSWKHEDDKFCFDKEKEWFIVGVDTPEGSYTYHYEKKYWDMFDCEELDRGKHWDGHTEEDVTRLLSLPPVEPERPLGEWIPCSKRLPKEEKKTYWVCTDTGCQCECRWTNNRFGISVGEWGWSIFDTPQYTKPIAWMPLPEPYREDGEE